MLGCILSWAQNGESVNFIRTERTYKRFISDCSKINNSNIHSVESFSKISPCANGQCSCTVVPHKNGGTQNKVLSQLNKEIWDYLKKVRLLQSIFQGQ